MIIKKIRGCFTVGNSQVSNEDYGQVSVHVRACDPGI